MARLAFRQEGRKQVVELDGEDISACIRSINISAEAWEAPEVSLQLAVFEIETGADESRIHIAEGTAELLQRLGWTPPAGES